MPATKLRSCKLVKEDGLDILVITEQTGRKERVDYYQLEKNPNAVRGYRLHKMVHSDEEPVVYDTLIDGEGSHCDCIGFEQHRTCKHVDSISALMDAEKI